MAPELDAAIGIALKGKSSATPSEILDAAERLLDKVLVSDCESRASALDLLTVDALITNALEACASESPADSEFAELAMARLASHGGL